MKKKETKAKRAARSCAANGCITYINVDERSATWKKCKHFLCLFCHKHVSEFKVHVAKCKKDDDSTNGDGMVDVKW